MDNLMLFTDGSVNNRLKVGYGAYLALTEFDLSPESIEPLLKLKRFEPVSSTKLEILTLLWALNEIPAYGKKIIIYTDSQNIISLPGRRIRFEKNEYRTKNKILIDNYMLYQEFYKITDRLNCELVKVDGHQKILTKNQTDRIFTIVDKASRKKLREEIKDTAFDYN
jgi:ribonuclease HI